ncbi:universal stress protein [Bombilactobacillus thymidiniphilus]|uniref:Universal stress protein n=1 Tax=Bombilactobacillus thymidiniphilus TaxID=2923363 RepID=A0ABY4PBN0_9LACO|nr:universal stress protein [Bombilactobacillus thymidiniphilus]UQS83087.1 universal stress protein [Bombilactobacillus thymidiniphilus]
MKPNSTQLRNYHVETVEYQRALVAVDIDDFTSSERAFNYACTVARNNSMELGIVAVLETKDINVFESLSPDSMENKRLQVAHDLLLYVKKAQDYGVEHIKPILTEGQPDHVIMEKVVPDFEPDLIIVGSETKKFLGKTVGSQAEGIVEYSPVSVIVVR